MAGYISMHLATRSSSIFRDDAFPIHALYSANVGQEKGNEFATASTTIQPLLYVASEMGNKMTFSSFHD